MKAIGEGIEIKRLNRIRTIKYILDAKKVSRQDIAAALGFSMPTVLQNVADLIDCGLVCEAGEYGSTGGRKAKALSICEGARCAIGVEVTAHHLHMALLDLSQKVWDLVSHRFPFRNTQEYYVKLGELVQEFAQKDRPGMKNNDTLTGVGFSIPGILDQNQGMLLQSYALGVSNINLGRFSYNVPYNTCFDNDANNAAYAEITDKQRNTIYLSLNDTVGGATYINGRIYQGDHYKSAEFGHMIIVPNGKKCYCGKRGCLDSYCSARTLKRSREGTLEQFFDDLKKGVPENKRIWDTYLEYLALAVANLRMAYDCDIILGGNIGGNMEGHMHMFQEKLRKYNNFDYDASYIRLGRHKRECSAIGAARLMQDRYIEKIETFSVS